MFRLKGCVLIFMLLLVSKTALTQSLNYPNYALKSHPTLEISRVEMNSDNTVMYLTIENRIVDGSFCADRNIYLIQPNGERLKLVNFSGIPVCPDTYNFKEPGEKLNFTLTFPPLKEGTLWVDLIEDCSENCFSFYGVILDNDLNKRIEDAFLLAENDEPGKALDQFIIIADEKVTGNSGIEALLYINIITLAREAGKIFLAEEWYSRLKSSGIPELKLYLNNLNSQGIKY